MFHTILVLPSLARFTAFFFFFSQQLENHETERLQGKHQTILRKPYTPSHTSGRYRVVTMVVKIRLARLSKRRQPFYNIVVAKARSARDSRPMEVLGTYNPVPQTPLASNFAPSASSSSSAATDATVAATASPQIPRKYKDIQLDITRTKYWLGVGAQPSEGVQGILGLLGLWEGKPGTRAAEGRTNESVKKPEESV